MNYLCKIPSPLGTLTLSSNGQNLTGLWLDQQKYFAATLDKDVGKIVEEELPLFDDARKWLDQYFSGQEPDFQLPLAPAGSEFRQAVWKILLEIPYGQVITYGDIAKRLERQGERGSVSARPVGGAVGHNPISILIPCHRVIGANGSLTGYAGGIANKIRLLKLEGVDVEKFSLPAGMATKERPAP